MYNIGCLTVLLLLKSVWVGSFYFIFLFLLFDIACFLLQFAHLLQSNGKV